MNMNVWLWSGLPLMTFLLLASPSTYARLGETEDQCNARYGKPSVDTEAGISPLIRGAKHLRWHWQGWSIRAAFVDGLTCRFQYSKSKILPDELAAILQAESNGGTWRELALSEQLSKNALAEKLLFQSNASRAWVRPDGARAILKPFGGTLLFEDAHAKERDDQLAREAEEKRKASIPKF